MAMPKSDFPLTMPSSWFAHPILEGAKILKLESRAMNAMSSQSNQDANKPSSGQFEMIVVGP